VFRHDETCLASCRCLIHHLYESSLLPILSVRVRKHGYFISSTERPCSQAFWKADVYFHHRWLRFEQCGPHHGTRNEAHLRLQRFRFLPALEACCCSLWVSPPKSRSRNSLIHNVDNVVFILLVVLRRSTYLDQFFDERNVNNEGTTSTPSRHEPRELARP
jgi:hypothetical protein